MTAMVALIPVAAQGSCSAYLDGTHHPQMMAGQPMGFSIRGPVPAEDIRHLQAARCSHPLSGLRLLFGEGIEGRGNLGQIHLAHM